MPLWNLKSLQKMIWLNVQKRLLKFLMTSHGMINGPLKEQNIIYLITIIHLGLLGF
ncbi:hypothetical protein CMALT430_230049 [Carnobacterium maltaromaticum]|nr:hypothetical protein CMALT430_230049 [Carnobacterium maltaromaticum]